MPVLIACGTDIEEYSRFAKYIDVAANTADQLIHDLFTEEELQQNSGPEAAKSFTAGFAFKEALYKAFSALKPAHNASWKEMALIRDHAAEGGYMAVLSGNAAEIHAECGAPEIRIKINFGGEYVTAEILLIRET